MMKEFYIMILQIILPLNYLMNLTYDKIDIAARQAKTMDI